MPQSKRPSAPSFAALSLSGWFGVVSWVLTQSACGKLEPEPSRESSAGPPKEVTQAATESEVPEKRETAVGPKWGHFQTRVDEENAAAGFAPRTAPSLAVADINQDGLADIVVGSLLDYLTVFENLGDFRFRRSDWLEDKEVVSTSHALIDFTGDGELDLVTSTAQEARFYALRDGKFELHQALPMENHLMPEESFGTTTHILGFDPDHDGDVDVLISTRPPGRPARPPSPRVFFENLGEAKMENRSQERGFIQDGNTLATANYPMPEGGPSYVFVANDTHHVDFGTESGSVLVSREDSPGDSFLAIEGAGDSWFVTDRADDWGLGRKFSSMGALVEDLDANGLLDIFISDFGPNKWWAALGPELRFEERAESFGLAQGRWLVPECEGRTHDPDCLLVSWGAAAADFDHDGQQDLIVVHHAENESVAGPIQAYVRKDGPFEERSLGIPDVAGHSLVPADFDADGDLDLLVGTIDSPLLFLENQVDDSRTLRVELRGTSENRMGLGSVVEASFENGYRQIEGLGLGGVIHTSLPPEAVFSLPPDFGKLTSFRVRWPSGVQEDFAPSQAEGLLVFHEGEGSKVTPQ